MPRLSNATDRPGRLKLLLRRSRRWMRPGGVLLAGLLLAAAVSAMVHAIAPAATVRTVRERFGALTAAAGLRVRDIVVEGRASTPEPLLRAALGVSRGDPILGFSVAAARARIETLASVQSVSVERRLPATIFVALTERRPIAIWQNQGRFALIDRGGAVLPDENPVHATGLPLVVGVGAPEHAAELLDALAALPTLQSHLVAAVRVGERRWNLRMKDGADVLLPEDGEAAALQRLADLQRDHALLDRPLQVVDLRLPDRLVLRPQPDAATAAATPAGPTAPGASAGSAPGTGPAPGAGPSRPAPAKRPT
ncbi:MAG: cell division protein FtsQ/DivIB [Acidisphaera sp.]|nr:cell division protein FtsQ/DivIB [Acidisphaera sp.]